MLLLYVARASIIIIVNRTKRMATLNGCLVAINTASETIIIANTIKLMELHLTVSMTTKTNFFSPYHYYS